MNSSGRNQSLRIEPLPPAARSDPFVRSLSEHLARYGVTPVASGEDFDDLLEERVPIAQRRGAVRRALSAAGRGDPAGKRRLYRLLADADAGPALLSWRGGAIVASGVAVAQNLTARRRVLDLGCSTGYLSTWYAELMPKRQVVGVDVEAAVVDRAQALAAELGFAGATFQRADLEHAPLPDEAFDAVVDTQTLYHAADVPAALANVRASCTPGARLISVSVLPRASDLRGYLAAVRGAGFGIDSLGATVFHRTPECTEYRAFPVVVATAGGPNQPLPDAELWYASLARSLRERGWLDLLDRSEGERHADYDALRTRSLLRPSVRNESDLWRLVAQCAAEGLMPATRLEQALLETGWGYDPDVSDDDVVHHWAPPGG